MIDMSKNNQGRRFRRTMADVRPWSALYPGDFAFRKRRYGKLSEEVIDELCRAFENGHPPEFAAACVGVQYKTLLGWIKKGEENYDYIMECEENGIPLRDEDYTLFFSLFVSVKRALYQCHDEALKVFKMAYRLGDWRAAARFLERRFPDQWGKKLSRDEKEVMMNQGPRVLIVPARCESREEWEVLVAEEDKRRMLESKEGGAVLEGDGMILGAE